MDGAALLVQGWEVFVDGVGRGRPQQQEMGATQTQGLETTR